MKIDGQAILQKVRKIYLRETGFSYDHEIDNDSALVKMNGIKVDGDDLSIFIKAVQTDFDIPMTQSDCDSFFTLRNVADYVIKRLQEKQGLPEIGLK